MGLFKKKVLVQTYDKENKKPVIKSSICNGEQVAGFKDIRTGKMEEIMLIKKYSRPGNVQSHVWDHRRDNKGVLN